MRPSLLKLQVGPVQDFIAQARSTRDLWSGSYLVSWLMAHALRGLTSAPGRVRVVFPAVAAADGSERTRQPLVRYLREGGLSSDLAAQAVLTSNLPNVLLAVVPDSWTKTEVDEHVLRPMRKQWEEEMEMCLEHYQTRTPFSQEETQLFRLQAERFWDFTWQLWPIQSHSETLALLRKTGDGAQLADALEASPPGATAPEGDHLWPAHFRLVSHRLEARRQARNFDAWPATPLATRDKDALSGHEEAIADKAWLARAQKHPELRYRFRNGDQLGAPNLIRRIWDLGYLKRRHPRLIEQRVTTWDSVPAVAATPWLAELKERLSDERVETAFWAFISAAGEASAFLPLDPFPQSGLPWREWLDRVDAQIFHDVCWEQWRREAAKNTESGDRVETMFQPPLATLEALRKAAGLGKPSRYYAVLALDGDEMGRWLLGRKRPDGNPITRKWHEGFSQALADFSLDHVRKEVEAACGQPIYAGGDDVLALLPAETAIACAVTLAAKFRSVVGGIAPGVTASVGLAIGHMKEPLQDMVQAAQHAEKRAKNQLDRNALAVTLFKRSGETVQWGAKFDSRAFQLLDSLQPLYRTPLGQPEAEMPVSGRFPHRVIQMLANFGPETPVNRLVEGTSIADLAEAELAWILRQQTRQAGQITTEDQLQALRVQLLDACREYLAELKAAARPLCEFYHLLALEGFIARQGD